MIDKYSEYLKNLDAEASMLLGSFNADDNYVFDEKIKAELIACNKLIESFKPDVITAKATIGTYVFKFYLYIQDGENDLKRVGLFLEEKSKLGLVDKNMISYVDSVVLKYSSDFYNQIKQIYHLFTADDSDGIDMANNNLQEIIKKLNLLKGKYELFIPLFLDLDKKYVIEMLALIKSSGRYGEMLLLNIKRLISEKGISKQQPNYWRELKLIVDKLLYENIGVFDKNTKEKIDLIRTKFLAESKNIKAPENVIEKKPKKSAPASKKSDDKKAGDKKKSSSKKKSSKSNKDSSKEEKSSKIDPIQSKYMSESFSTNNDPFIFGLSWHSINYKENNSTNIPSVLNRKSVSSNKKNNGGPERE